MWVIVGASHEIFVPQKLEWVWHLLLSKFQKNFSTSQMPPLPLIWYHCPFESISFLAQLFLFILINTLFPGFVTVTTFDTWNLSSKIHSVEDISLVSNISFMSFSLSLITFWDSATSTSRSSIPPLHPSKVVSFAILSCNLAPTAANSPPSYSGTFSSHSALQVMWIHPTLPHHF